VSRRDERRHDVDIEAYDQWLAWEHGLRLRRAYRIGSGDRDDTDTPNTDWGDQVAIDASLHVVAPDARHMVADFYERLFVDSPRLRALFPDQMGDQRERLLSALLAVVGEPAPTDDLIEQLKQLGRDHRKFGARPAHYASVGKALVGALSTLAGEAWTPEVERAWLARYTAAANVMLAAADSDTQPPYWYATVVRHQRRNTDVAILHLAPRQPYAYEPGQYATLVSRRLPRVWRPYTMATAAPTGGELEFHVRALGHGGLSDVLVAGTTVGDVVRIGPPQGTATLRRGTGQIRVFVASGIGWAPTKALLDQIAHNGSESETPAHLIYIGTGGALYDPGWTQLLQRCRWLSTTIAGSLQDVAGCLPPRVDPAHVHAHVGGPPALAEAVSAELAHVGVAPANILIASWPGA
jgi:NAD(P)H-flavin reductase/hemoglobin-like flavoprotein